MANRIFAFKTQRCIATFAIFGIGFFFTTSALWNHLDNVLVNGRYQWMAKAGLLLVPCVALIMTIWELFVPSEQTDPRADSTLKKAVARLVNWCFWGAILLVLLEIVHAGALLKYEESIQSQTGNLEAAAKAQGIIEAARIEAAGRAAADVKSRTRSTTLATRTLRAGTASTAGKEIADQAAGIKGSTFLPQVYVDGGMYVALPVLAIIFFAITMLLARQAQHMVDADGNGIPDYLEKPKPEPRPVGFVPRSPLNRQLPATAVKPVINGDTDPKGDSR